MKRCGALLGVVLTVLATGQPLRSFNSIPHNDHKQLTMDALAAPSLSDCALSKIADASGGVDLGIDYDMFGEETFRYHWSHHFDRVLHHAFSFQEGVDYIWSRVAFAKSALAVDHKEEALRALGEALHALQDFFSHSNFVDDVDGLDSTERAQVMDALFQKSTFIPARLKLTYFDTDATDDDDPLSYSHKEHSKDPPTRDGQPAYAAQHSLAKTLAKESSTRLVSGVVDEFESVLCKDRSHPVTTVNSQDPNEKHGPSGVGLSRFVVGDDAMGYVISFENVDTATAPAQDVVVEDRLDLTQFDTGSFRFGPINFGEHVLVPPSGTSYSALVDLRPDTDLLVKVDAALNVSSGHATWRFRSVEPGTNGPPADPLAGFLPPGGEGQVSFTIRVKPELPTGTQISNEASIVFDSNAAIRTQPWTNAVDKAPPASRVTDLPATVATTEISLTWTGVDEGAGIDGYSVFVSEDGGPFSSLLSGTNVESTIFRGRVGHSYAFYSLATDLAGNAEVPKDVADTTTTVVQETTPPVISPVVSGFLGHDNWYVSPVTLRWDVDDPESGVVSSTGCEPVELSTDTLGVSFRCSATNGIGLHTSVLLELKVDRTPPSLSGLPSTCMIWPPNGDLVQIGTISASDPFSGITPGSLSVTGVTNEESPSQDIVVSPTSDGSLAIQLRAKRLGTNRSREYLLTATVTDGAGNVATRNFGCVVPHDQGR